MTIPNVVGEVIKQGTVGGKTAQILKNSEGYTVVISYEPESIMSLCIRSTDLELLERYLPVSDGEVIWR